MVASSSVLVGLAQEETEIMGRLCAPLGANKRFNFGHERIVDQKRSRISGKYYDFPAVKSFPKPAQTPHPPIFIGGSAKNVFKRIVEWATAGCR
jgi:alkanesulfonate monooxygenase SsuD/methylene tetrahydromethanopterin reductase-like flavin-dependent oxidoreductase (luciferase family)